MKNTALAKWRRDRLGMFIHWGLYAIPAGIWKGKEMADIGESLMCKFRVPRKEYAKLAKEFNPTKFNAEEWVVMAKEAGFRYIVITAKHHDGFAMFKTKASSFNIVDATPYGKDPMKELAEACRKYGIKLGFYYSHCLDWYHIGGAGNTWEPETRNGDPKAFKEYLDNLVKPQLKELLTQYGPICLLWFDTSAMITKEQALELQAYVKDIQSDCLVSGRLYETEQEIADYISMGDNELPDRKKSNGKPFEGLITTNDTWGFKKNDLSWKTPGELIRILNNMVGHDANLLINVGPTAEGTIPSPAVKNLLEMGKWLKVNGNSIYGNYGNPIPIPAGFHWFKITHQGNKLFIHLHKWPECGFFDVHGLKNKILSIKPLAAPNQSLDYTEDHDFDLNYHLLRINIPKQKIGNYVSVLEITTEGDIEVNPKTYFSRGF